MPAFTLKRYQAQALDALAKYLRAARLTGARAAFEGETGYGYNPEPFGDTPCVCLRIPTGGGKTLLAAHAVGLMASEWPSLAPRPLALWLVPSDTIRTQTLAALRAPGHPFREALAQACGDSVRVCELGEVATLAPQGFDACAVVVVATMQSFRVEDTDQRNVYAFSEAFEPHFRGVPALALNALRDLPDACVTADEAGSAKAGREMLARFVGQPRWSLANWLALRQPYVIVDEAHNTKTERSFEALKRLNPALILELTATPVPRRTNVLFSVSAQQLQAEHMIKMPIALIEHTRGWQAAVLDAVQTQRLLEREAQQEEAATEAETGLAANALADRLIDGMGFDPLDMASMIAPQLPLDMARDDGPLFATPAPGYALPALAVDLPAAKPLPAAVAQAVEQGHASVSTDGERQRVQLRGMVGEALAAELVAAQRGKQRENVTQQIERHNALVTGALAPANRGARFAPVPRLCYRAAASQGELQLLEREALTDETELNLLAKPVTLAGFNMVEQDTLWQVYLDGQRLRVGRGDAAQLPLDAVHSSITEGDLARWVAAELQHPSRNLARDVTPAHLRAFVLATVRHLVHEQRIPLERLARHQYPLVQQLALRVAELRDQASKAAFTQLVLDGGWAVEASAAFAFEFDPACYPVSANKRYRGKFRFPKHFYPVLSDLDDGGEEWRCALAIDEHRAVRHWVRNLDSDPVAGFWLPTSSGRFYPDFVCELNDGRLFVAEYKGEHLRGVPREIEKGQVGRVWAEHSAGKCVFAMLFKLEAGLSVTQQIDVALR